MSATQDKPTAEIVEQETLRVDGARVALLSWCQSALAAYPQIHIAHLFAALVVLTHSAEDRELAACALARSADRWLVTFNDKRARGVPKVPQHAAVWANEYIERAAMQAASWVARASNNGSDADFANVLGYARNAFHDAATLVELKFMPKGFEACGGCTVMDLDEQPAWKEARRRATDRLRAHGAVVEVPS